MHDEKLKETLKKETERYIAEDILYDDVYVGPFTEKDGVDCAVHAVEWYRNHVWHPASEEPVNKSQCLVVSSRNTKEVVTYSNKFFYKGHVVAEPCKIYELADIVMWAYIDELLPEKHEVQKSTMDDYFTSDTNRSFIRWSIDKMLSDEFNRKWKYNEYNESSIKLIRLGAFDGYHQAIIDILTFIHTNMSDEDLHNPLVWKLCMFINYFGKWNPMLELCNKLNTLLFEKTEENEKKIKQLIRENITEHPERKIFYDENLFSEDKSLEAVIRKKSMFFVPTEDQKCSPGIIVKYRKKEH